MKLQEAGERTVEKKKAKHFLAVLQGQVFYFPTGCDVLSNGMEQRVESLNGYSYNGAKLVLD